MKNVFQKSILVLCTLFFFISCSDSSDEIDEPVEDFIKIVFENGGGEVTFKDFNIEPVGDSGDLFDIVGEGTHKNATTKIELRIVKNVTGSEGLTACTFSIGTVSHLFGTACQDSNPSLSVNDESRVAGEFSGKACLFSVGSVFLQSHIDEFNSISECTFNVSIK